MARKGVRKLKNYELLSIIKPNFDTDEVDKIIAQLEEYVSNLGGKISDNEKIGRKKLAFDVQGFRDGFFASLIMELPADKVAEFKRQLRLNDSILRIMFLEVSAKASV